MAPASVSLYRETFPPTTGTPSDLHASASPSTERTSCHATVGLSGLPKLRQLVTPSGWAPTQARFCAHSSTASTVPRYGSQATRRPLPSIATAIAPPVSSSLSTAASASSGLRTVRDWTIESYCWKAHRFEATFEEASRAMRTSEGEADGSSDARFGYGHSRGSRGSSSYSGHPSISAETGALATGTDPLQTRIRPGSVTSPDVAA